MCHFQQLFSDENGYVVRCNKCGYYQVLFLSSMISINEKEFQKFITQIDAQRIKNEQLDPEIRSIVLPTPRPGMHLFLSITEFGKFQKMMESAEAETKALAMLDLFYS